MATRFAPWESTPLNELAGAPLQVRVASAHMFALGNRLLLFGGFAQGARDYLSDLRQLMVDESGAAASSWSVVLTKKTGAEEALSSPAARIGYAGCVHQGRLFILGGQSTTLHRDLMAFSMDVGVWSRVGEFPHAVFGHGMTGHKGKLYAYGGVNGDTGKSTGELWALTLGGGGSAWQRLADGEPRSDYGSLCVFQESLVVFGGISDTKYDNSVRRYRLDSNAWETVECHGDEPSARSRHTSEVWKSFLVVYGGSAATDDTFDGAVYMLDLASRVWHAVRSDLRYFSPSARRDHAACVIKDAMYVYGGKTSRTGYAEQDLLRLHLDIADPRAEGAVVFSTGEPGRVLTCGFAGHGALGLGKSENAVRATAVTELAHRRMASVAAAGGRTACVDTTGAVFEWGQGLSSTPRLVGLGGEKAVHVSCGVLHTVCVLRSGAVLFWQVGSTAREVEALKCEGRIEMAESTALNSFFVTERNRVLSWTAEDPGAVQVVAELDEPVRQIACGGDHVLLRTVSGAIWSWGSANKNGELGRAGDPRVMGLVEGADFVARHVACGPGHSLAISEAGELYSWGLGSSGQLGNGKRESESRPRRVDLGEEKVVQCAAGGGLGCFHTLAVTADADAVLVFGSNKFGQLGDGSLTDWLTPRRVPLPGVKSVAAGWVHSVFVCSSEEKQQVTASPENLLGMFGILPRDLRRLLLSHMSSVALGRLACCSSALRTLADDDELWKALYAKQGGSVHSIVQSTFKSAYVQRFGPKDRPVKQSRWGISAFRPIQILMSGFRFPKKECRILMVGLDAAGKTTILCKSWSALFGRDLITNCF